MGLGRTLNRAVQYEVTNTETGATELFTIETGKGVAADWARGPYAGGMAHPGAWRAAVLLSDLLGSLPWYAERERGDQDPEKLSPTPPLLDQPHPPDTRMSTFSGAALDLIWHGNAIAIVADRDRHGWPTAMVPRPADQVQVARAQPGDGLPFPVGTVVYGFNVAGGGQRWWSSEDVVHVKGPARAGALRGMGVLECHLTGALKLAGELQKQAGAIADNAVPSMLIKSDDPDMSEADATELKTSYMKSQRTRQPAVMNANTTLEPLAWNPSETQLLDARKFTLNELALIFGLDPSWLGASQTSRVYSNIEQEAINLVKFSLGGHLARFEQELSRHFPRGTRAKANLDALLRSDTLSRYQAHKIGIDAGFLTDDEARALEGRAPLTPEQRRQLAARRPTPVAPRPASGALDDDEPDEDDAAERAAEWAAELDDMDRAAGNELEHYWKRGEGRAKWVGHAHPWTALYRHLRDKVGPARAKRIASQWFRDVFGMWPGERKGANPAGRG